MREELFLADGRMDRQAGRQAGRQTDRQAGRKADRHDDDNVCFVNFANAPKNKGVTQNI